MSYEPLFPYEVVEILNGILGPALFWMTFFLVMHLHREWRGTRARFSGKGGLLRSLAKMYVDHKPEIALFTIVSFLCVRTFILWWVRFLKNNNIKWDDAVTRNSGELLIVLTVVIIIGVVCWIRVISPYSGRRAVILWTIMVVSSVAFGVGMHYVF